jgi:exonuclease VII large subunit
MLKSLSYKNVLARGFAIVRDKDNNIISTNTAVPASIEFSDGTLKLN